MTCHSAAAPRPHTPCTAGWRGAHAADIPALQRFVRTLRRDLRAVEGAVREPWSNGPVEGHINRLKMRRQQMYGCAGVELLRARLLSAPSATL